MKFSTLVMTTLMTFQAGIFASAASSDTQGSVTGLCLECMERSSKIKSLDQLRAITSRTQTPSRESSLRDQVARAGVAKVTEGATAATEAKAATPMDRAPMCDKWVDNNELKSWGKLVAKAFKHESDHVRSEMSQEQVEANGNYKELYAGPRDIQLLCPKYSKMNIDQKDAFWAMIAGQWSFFESTCKPDTYLTQKGGAPNGTAYGLFQLHLGKEHTYSSGCRRGDAKDPERSIKCAFSMMNDKVSAGEDFFSKESYWAVLRPQNRTRSAGTGVATPQFLMKQVCSYAPCGSNMTDCNKYIAQFTNSRQSVGASKSKGTTKRVAVAR